MNSEKAASTNAEAKRKGREFISKQQMENFPLRSHSWHFLNWEMYASQEEMVLSSILLMP